jgi:hypothetical protein
VPESLIANGAGWFTVAAAVGTIFFLGRLVLMFVGGDAGMDVDFDGDVPHGDPGDAFKVLSIQSIAAFMMGFGWGGLAGINGFGWTWIGSMGFGIVMGAAMVWVLGLLLKAVHDLQSSGNVRIEQAVGVEGQVYANVPANGEGRGQVQLVVGGRQRIYNAISEGEAIASQSRVRVVRVNEDRSLTVTRA